jgi:UDP-GlcNAc:undecaprenyl-phosphate GlcNAc-1-phosphate transferase
VNPSAAWLLGAVVAALASALLAALARRFGLGDAPDARTSARKRQAMAVPFVGGSALLVAWTVQASCAPAAWSLSLPVGPLAESISAATCAERWGPWAALAAAFAVGLVDDLRPAGLAPLPKLCAQALAGAILATAIALAANGGEPLGLNVAGAGAFALWTAAAMAAMNLLNTFDNADGAAGGLGLVGLVAGAPLAAGALAGFLPFNLWLRRRGDPRAYLGDSGSHLLGMMLLLTPAAWPLFLLPLLDLARVAAVRLREGRPIWSADRLHLAHRLQAAGLAPTAVVAVLVGIALPALLVPGWVGALWVAVLFAACLRLTPAGGAAGS